jgi:spermidine synthase
MSSAIHEQSDTIFHEMMSHPALFTHSQPKKVIILGDEQNSILQEVCKHGHLAEILFINKKPALFNANSRIQFYANDSTDWIKKITPHSIDIIINADQPNPELLNHFFSLMHIDGILIQQSSSPFEMPSVKSLADQLRLAGFKEQHILHFPQPSFFSGWRSIIMATKQAGFKRIREHAIYNKPFKTYYYNLDTHKAALVLPEFMRKEWVI